MSERSRLRLFVLQVLVVSTLATLLGRLWFLQVYDGEAYAKAAVDNRVREVVTAAARGDIYDVAGRQLVRNRTALVVSVNRSLLLREPEDGKQVLERLSKVVGIPAADIARSITPCGPAVKQPCYVGSPYQPVPVVTYDVRQKADVMRVLAIEEHREDFPSVTAEFQAVREYPQKTRAAHVLGYLGRISDKEKADPAYAGYLETAAIGRGGVEQVYDRALHGVDGVQRLAVDKDGSVTGILDATPAVAGDKLVLSLDNGVQKIAEDALAAAIAKARATVDRNGGGRLKADSGSVVVMEAKTGRVVALASFPSYDPAVFTGGISGPAFAALNDEANGAPLLFRAIQGGYAPASTFKPISAAAAVENGQTTFDTVSACPGRYAPTGQTNFEAASLGALSLRTAIVRSCDTNFYKFAYDAWLRDGGNNPTAAPKDPMIRTALGFGLYERTGIDLPAESRGLIPTRSWRKAYWQQTKAFNCKAATTEPAGSFLQRLAADNCADGFKFRGGQSTNFAIGQGETVVTPLQLASVYASIANGGTLVTPTVARALLSADGKRVTEIATPSRGRVPVRPQTLARLRDALRGVTSEQGGTGYRTFKDTELAVAGKTGTAQVNGKQSTSWFASFAPSDAPQLVVVGMVSQGGTGATTAAPMVRAVYEGIFGLAGKKAALPGGRLPALLPRVRSDGTVAPPGAKVTGPQPQRAPSPPRTVPTPRTLEAAPAPGAPAAPPAGPSVALAAPSDLPPRRVEGRRP